MAAARERELTLQEAADLLGVHYMTAYRYVRTGRLAATRINGKWVVARSSLDRDQAPIVSDQDAYARLPAMVAIHRAGLALLAGDLDGTVVHDWP